MALSKILNDTITLFNYIGEDADGNPNYQKTYFNNVYFKPIEGMTPTVKGDDSSSSANLFIFDCVSKARGIMNREKTFCDYSLWEIKSESDKYWTLSPDGKDYVVQGHIKESIDPANIAGAMVINSFIHYNMGLKRHHHWEINAS